jgi:hypothetical protein
MDDDRASPTPPTLSYATPIPSAPLDVAIVRSLMWSAFFLLTPVPSIVATVYAVVGLRRVRRPRGRGFVIGCIAVVLGLAGIAAWIAVPTMGVRRLGERRRLQCMSNLRSIAQSAFIYAADHRGSMPANWDDLLSDSQTQSVARFLVSPRSGQTPARGATTQALIADFHAGAHCSYVYLAQGRRITRLRPNDVLAFEVGPSHSGGRVCVGHLDGSVVCLPRDQAMAEVQRTINRLASLPPPNVRTTTRR